MNNFIRRVHLNNYWHYGHFSKSILYSKLHSSVWFLNSRLLTAFQRRSRLLFPRIYFDPTKGSNLRRSRFRMETHVYRFRLHVWIYTIIDSSSAVLRVYRKDLLSGLNVSDFGDRSRCRFVKKKSELIGKKTEHDREWRRSGRPNLLSRSENTVEYV